MEASASSVLKAASHTLVIQPSIVDSAEHQTKSGLTIVQDNPEYARYTRPYRGIVLDIGAHIDEPNAERGSVVHYSAFAEVVVDGDKYHVATTQHILAFE